MPSGVFPCVSFVVAAPEDPATILRLLDRVGLRSLSLDSVVLS